MTIKRKRSEVVRRIDKSSGLEVKVGDKVELVGISATEQHENGVVIYESGKGNKRIVHVAIKRGKNIEVNSYYLLISVGKGGREDRYSSRADLDENYKETYRRNISGVKI